MTCTQRNADDVLGVIALACLMILATQPALGCWLLLVWLWRRRRLRVPASRRHLTAKAHPASHPRAKPDWARDKVIYLAAHLRSCRAVTIAFNRWHGSEFTVGKTWVWETMRAHREEILQLRRRIRRARPAFFPVGHSWALDLTFLASSAGATFTVLGILDAGSRKLLRLKVLPRKCALTILGNLLLAFAEHGMPRAIRTDNESMFTSAIWATTLRALAIKDHRGPPCQPWRNGRIERFFATMKAVLGRRWTSSPRGLQHALEGFARFYNRARPHQALSGLMPAEAWAGITMEQVQEVGAARYEWPDCSGGFHRRE